MSNWEFYTALPGKAGKIIDQAVQDFAEEHGLNSDRWVQDLPLWFIWEEDEELRVVRRLQVGVCKVDGVEELRIVPQIFSIDQERRTIQTLKQIETDLIVSADISIMEKIDNATEVLFVAWEKVKKMTLPSYSNDAISIPISRHYRTEEL